MGRRRAKRKWRRLRKSRKRPRKSPQRLRRRQLKWLRSGKPDGNEEPKPERKGLRDLSRRSRRREIRLPELKKKRRTQRQQRSITRRRPSITSRRKRRPLRRLKGPRKSKLQRGNGRMSKSESAESAMRDGGPTAQLTQSAGTQTARVAVAKG